MYPLHKCVACESHCIGVHCVRSGMGSRQVNAVASLLAVFLSLGLTIGAHAQQEVPVKRVTVAWMEDGKLVQIVELGDGGVQIRMLADGEGNEVMRQSALKDWANRMASSIQHGLTEELRHEIEAIHSTCTLTDGQKDKLRLAGQGDIARIMRRLEIIQQKCKEASIDNEQYKALENELHVLRTSPTSNPFGEKSLFRKAMRMTLTDEQIQYGIRSNQIIVVQKALEILRYTGKEFQLTDEQQRKVVELLLTRTNPPTRVGKYGPYLVLYNAAKLEAPLKQILNEDQWAVFQDRIAFARTAVPRLHAQGLLPEFNPNEMPQVLLGL
jgi:hypothetical protein